MKSTIEVHHKGIIVKIRKRVAARNDAEYTDYLINDYSSGKRVRHARASLEEARDKAKEICEQLAGGKREAVHWPDRVIADVRRSLDLIHAHHVGILDAAIIFSEAAKLVPVDEILLACRHWRDNGPGKRFTPKRVKDAADELLAKQVKSISPRRYRTNKSYLAAFTERFGGRSLHEIETRELKDWAGEQKWCPRTRNDVLGVVSLLYQDAIERKHALVNPAKFRREKVPSADIQIYGPKEARTMLAAVDDDLKPFLATILFSGLRKQEATRVSAVDVESALNSGVFFLHGSKAKNKVSRSITVMPNLRKWLERYHRPGTSLLPERFQSMQALDDLHKLIERRSGVPWLRNAARHAFGTFFLKLNNDLSATTNEMGNSLVQLSRHYVSRARAITKVMAEEYFAVEPETTEALEVPGLAHPEFHKKSVESHTIRLANGV